VVNGLKVRIMSTSTSLQKLMNIINSNSIIPAHKYAAMGLREGSREELKCGNIS
jgi:hypothetical protein